MRPTLRAEGVSVADGLRSDVRMVLVSQDEREVRLPRGGEELYVTGLRLYFYVAGSGLARSQARQRYQLATEHHGCHFFARRRMTSGLGRSMGVTLSVGLSLPKVRAKPLRTPKSSTGRTLGRPRRKISNISTVQRPMPRTWVRCSMMASSGMRRMCCKSGTVPSIVLAARSRRASILFLERPAARSCSFGQSRRC